MSASQCSMVAFMAADIPEITARFGAACRSARLRLDYTQSAVVSLLKAHGIDLQPTALTRIESGRRDIKYSEALALSQVLGVPIEAPRDADQDVLGRLLSRARNSVVEHGAKLESATAKLQEAIDQAALLEELHDGAEAHYEDARRLSALFAALNDLSLGRKATLDDAPLDAAQTLTFSRMFTPDEVADALVAAGASEDDAFAAADVGSDRKLRQRQLTDIDASLAGAARIADVLRGLSGLTFTREDGWHEARARERDAERSEDG